MERCCQAAAGGEHRFRDVLMDESAELARDDAGVPGSWEGKLWPAVWPFILNFGLAFLISASRRQDGNKKKLFSDLDETPCAPVTLVFAKNFFSYKMCNLAPLVLPLSLFGSFHSSWSGRPCVCSHRGPQALHESSKWCFSIPALDSPLQKFLVLLQTNSIS